MKKPFFCAILAFSCLASACGDGRVRYYEAPRGAPPIVASGTPIVAVIDTDAVMNIQGGQGVGVYVEYFQGGHWHVAWTCDTALTQETCAFDILVAVATGAIANVTTEGFTQIDAMSVLGPTQVQAATTTTTQVQGLLFDAEPGQSVQVTAAVGGQAEVISFFFVRGGRTIGGAGAVQTNPQIFQPSAG